MDNLSPQQKFDFYSHGIASGMTDIFTPFMGPPSRPEKTSPYAKKATAKWNMPESYIGENEYLRDTASILVPLVLLFLPVVTDGGFYGRDSLLRFCLLLTPIHAVDCPVGLVRYNYTSCLTQFLTPNHSGTRSASCLGTLQFLSFSNSNVLSLRYKTDNIHLQASKMRATFESSH